MGLTSASSLKALLVNRKRKKRERKYKCYYLSYLAFVSTEQEPSLACDGLRQPSLAFMGLCWPLLAMLVEAVVVCWVVVS